MRRAVRAACALAIGGVAASAVWSLTRNPAPARPAGEPLTATGYVKPGVLAPGRSVPLTADLFNPNYFGVSLSDPRLTGVLAPGGCPAADVVFTRAPRFAAQLDPWTSRTVPVGTLTMRAAAGSACRQADFTVALSFAAVPSQ